MTKRPRVLYLDPRYPWPPDRGDRIRSWGLLRQFTAIADVTLAAFTDRDPTTIELGPLVSMCERVEVLPHPDRQGRLNMLAAIPASEPFQVAFFRSTVMDALVERLRRESFDLVFGHLFRMYPYVRRFEGTRRVIDLSDSLALNLRRAVPVKPGLRKLAFRMESARVGRYEVDVMNGVDESWVVDEHDRADLVARAPRANVVVIPNGIDDTWGPVAAPAEAPERVLLLGDLTVGHNVDMALHLVHDIWPRVRAARPSAELVLVGRYGATVGALGARPGVTLTGFVPDLKPILAGSRLSVVPLRYGAGIQNKALETMAAGLPVVGTSIVNSAVGATPDEAIAIADGPEELASAIIGLLADPVRAARMGAAGRRHVLERFHWDEAGRRLATLTGAPNPAISGSTAPNRPPGIER